MYPAPVIQCTFPCRKNPEFHTFIFPLVCSRTLQNFTFFAKFTMANLLMDPNFQSNSILKTSVRLFQKRKGVIRVTVIISK